MHACEVKPARPIVKLRAMCRFDIIPTEGQRKLHALALCTLLHQPPPCLLSSLPTAVAHITSVWVEVSPWPAPGQPHWISCMQRRCLHMGACMAVPRDAGMPVACMTVRCSDIHTCRLSLAAVTGICTDMCTSLVGDCH